MKVEFDWKDFLVEQPDEKRLIIIPFGNNYCVGTFHGGENVGSWGFVGKTIEIKTIGVGAAKGTPTLTITGQLFHTIHNSVEKLANGHKQLWDYYNL